MEYKLGELYDVSNGLSKGGEYFGNGDPFLSFSTVFNHFFIPDKIENLVESTEKEQNKYSIRRGDIFITRTSETIEELGMSCVALNDYPKATFNGFCKRLRPKNQKVDPQYIGYYMRTPIFRANFLKVASLITRASLRNEDLLRFKVNLPNIEEQKRIASILSNYDNLIENNSKRIKLLEQMAENLYKEWFVRFRFPGYEDVEFDGTLPIGWQYQPISESMDFFDSQRVPLSSMQRDEMEKIYPYYGAAKLMDYVDNYLFDGEYLLLGEDGTVVTTDGFPVLQLVNDKFWVNNHAHVIRGKGNISTRFLYLTFCRFPISGVVTGSAQPKISKGRLVKLKILVPDAKIIELFNDLINPMFDEINVLKKQLIRITEQRDLLLPRLMNGKLEV